MSLKNKPVEILMRWTISDPKSQNALTNSLKWCIVLMEAKIAAWLLTVAVALLALVAGDPEFPDLEPFCFISIVLVDPVFEATNNCFTTTLSANSKIRVTAANNRRRVRIKASKSPWIKTGFFKLLHLLYHVSLTFLVLLFWTFLSYFSRPAFPDYKSSTKMPKKWLEKLKRHDK